MPTAFSDAIQRRSSRQQLPAKPGSDISTDVGGACRAEVDTTLPYPATVPEYHGDRPAGADPILVRADRPAAEARWYRRRPQPIRYPAPESLCGRYRAWPADRQTARQAAQNANRCDSEKDETDRASDAESGELRQIPPDVHNPVCRIHRVPKAIHENATRPQTSICTYIPSSVQNREGRRRKQ